MFVCVCVCGDYEGGCVLVIRLVVMIMQQKLCGYSLRI